MVKAILAKRWEVGAKHYAKGSVAFNEDNWCQIMKDLIPFSESVKALDVGTGPGVLAFVLARLGHDVTGLDLSQSMLEIAEENREKKGVSCSFVQGDAEDLPFESASFELVTNRLNLWTLPNPGKGVANWVRVLKPGGTLVIIVNDIAHPLDPNAKIPQDPKENNDIFSKEYHDSFINMPFAIAVPTQVKALVEAAGLENVEIRTFVDERTYTEKALLEYLKANKVDDKKLAKLIDDNAQIREQQLQNILDEYGLDKFTLQQGENGSKLVAVRQMAAIIGTKK